MNFSTSNKPSYTFKVDTSNGIRRLPPHQDCEFKCAPARLLLIGCLLQIFSFLVLPQLPVPRRLDR